MNSFVKASLIRCVRTIAQTAVAMIGTSALMSDVNWHMVISASLLSGILSILTSIATGLPEVDGFSDDLDTFEDDIAEWGDEEDE